MLGLRRSTVLLFLYMLGYMGYLVAGGLVFAALEGPYEMETKAILNVAIASFKTRNPNVTGRMFWSLKYVVSVSILVVTTKYKQTMLSCGL